MFISTSRIFFIINLFGCCSWLVLFINPIRESCNKAITWMNVVVMLMMLGADWYISAAITPWTDNYAHHRYLTPSGVFGYQLMTRGISGDSVTILNSRERSVQCNWQNVSHPSTSVWIEPLRLWSRDLAMHYLNHVTHDVINHVTLNKPYNIFQLFCFEFSNDWQYLIIIIIIVLNIL